MPCNIVYTHTRTHTHTHTYTHTHTHTHAHAHTHTHTHTLVFQEEIFGPLLPVLVVDSLDEAIAFVNDREKPLAFYIFTESKATFNKINKLTSAGGVCHNDTILQAGGMCTS